MKFHHTANSKGHAAGSVSKPPTPGWGAPKTAAAASSVVPGTKPWGSPAAKAHKTETPTIIAPPLDHAWSTLAATDLARSSITLEQADALRMFCVEDASNIFPEFRAEPATVIPYFNMDGSPKLFQRDGEQLHFCRVRYLHPPLKPFTGKPMAKYGQPERSGVHIYWPRNVDWAKVLADSKEVLFLGEGEKTSARIALEGYNAAGIGGCWMWRQEGGLQGIKQLDPELAQFAVASREIVLALDGDAATNKSVAAAEGLLALELGQRRGAAVHRMRFPFDDNGKRMAADDFIAQCGSEAFFNLVHASEKMGEADALVAELNQEYAVICIGGKTWVMRTEHDSTLNRRRLSFFSRRDFKDALANRSVASPTDPKKRPPLAEVWFQHPHRREFLNGLTLAPMRDVPDGVFNLWRGFSVNAVPGNWSLLRAHIFENVCSGNHEHFDYLMNWMARLIQRPWEAGQVAVVFRGGRGVGKGIVATNLGRILQDHFIHAIQADHVTGKFNGHLQDCVLLFGDEAFFAGDPRHEKILNGLITETTRLSEQKFQSAVTIPNYIHLILSTNSEWAIPAAIDERRYFVLDVPNHTHKQDTTYFGAIAAQIDAGGLAAMFHDLQGRDISRFDVRRVPQTAALADQKRHTLHTRGGTLAWLQDVLMAGEIKHMGDPPTPIVWGEQGLFVSRNDLFDAYETWERKRPGRPHPDSRETFGKRIQAALGDSFQGGDNLKLPKGFNAARPRAYRLASLAECRATFVATQRMPILWSADSE